NLQLSAGMALAHSAASGIQGIERGLDLSIRSISLSLEGEDGRRSSEGDLSRHFGPVLATGKDLPDLPLWFAMEGSKDGGSSEVELPSGLPREAIEIATKLIQAYPQAGPAEQEKIDVQVDAMIRSPDAGQFRMGFAILSHLLPHRSDPKRLLVTASALIRK